MEIASRTISTKAMESRISEAVKEVQKRVSRHSESSEESRKIRRVWFGRFLDALGMTCSGDFFHGLLQPPRIHNKKFPFLNAALIDLRRMVVLQLMELLPLLWRLSN